MRVTVHGEATQNSEAGTMPSKEPLSPVGKARRGAGSRLLDRGGASRKFVPGAFARPVGAENQDAADRARQAMRGMRKIGVAALATAYHGNQDSREPNGVGMPSRRRASARERWCVEATTARGAR